MIDGDNDDDNDDDIVDDDGDTKSSNGQKTMKISQLHSLQGANYRKIEILF